MNSKVNNPNQNKSLTRYRLFIPEPAEVAPETLAVMAEPVVMHYGKESTSFYLKTTALLGKILGTSAGLDMALGSIAGPGCVLVLINVFLVTGLYIL